VNSVTVYARLDRRGTRVLCGTRAPDGRQICRGEFGDISVRSEGRVLHLPLGFVSELADTEMGHFGRHWHRTAHARDAERHGRRPSLRRSLPDEPEPLEALDDQGVNVTCPICSAEQVLDPERLRIQWLSREEARR
jgi:hypothetical protein